MVFLAFLNPEKAVEYPQVRDDTLIMPVAVGSHRPEALLRPVLLSCRRGRGDAANSIMLATHNVMTLG